MNTVIIYEGLVFTKIQQERKFSEVQKIQTKRFLSLETADQIGRQASSKP